MERKGDVYGKIDLSIFYQSGLKFHGPKPKEKTLKLENIKGQNKSGHEHKKFNHLFRKRCSPCCT